MKKETTSRGKNFCGHLLGAIEHILREYNRVIRQDLLDEMNRILDRDFTVDRINWARYQMYKRQPTLSPPTAHLQTNTLIRKLSVQTLTETDLEPPDKLWASDKSSS